MFRVLAEVIPVKIEVDREEIDFRFSEESRVMYTTEVIKLTNHGNAAAEYEWRFMEGSPFSIEKMKGQVESGETLHVDITYTPDGKVGPKGDK